MIHRLFFDLETIPAGKEWDDYLEWKWAELKDKGAKAPDTVEEFKAQTALSGDFGRICCFGWAEDGKPAEAICESEKYLLNLFWKKAADTKLFVGHNILGFDLPFIMKRSMVHGIRPSRHIYLGKFKDDPVYDTMEQWSNWGRERTPLDALTRILGVDSPKDAGMDGSQVAKAFKRGHLRKIEKYCQADVDAVREVYRRMTFAPPPGKEVKSK